MVTANGEFWRHPPGRNVEWLYRPAEFGVHAHARRQCQRVGAARCARRRPESSPGAARRDLGENFRSIALFGHQAQALKPDWFPNRGKSGHSWKLAMPLA